MCRVKHQLLLALSNRFIAAIVVFLIIFPISSPDCLNAEEFGVCLEPNPEAPAGTATVYLIDKSSSMLWVYDQLRKTLKEAARKSEAGDALSIILFGDSTTILASYRSMNESKQKSLARLIDSIQPDSFYTNLSLAVKRGTESLHKYFEDGAAENYVLVLVTDGKNNPSPDYVQDYTIEEALTQYPEFLPGKQWSLRYIALESQVDPELLALVEQYGEDFFDVEKIAESMDSTQEEVVGSLLKDPLAWKPFGVMVVDQSGQVEVKRKNEQTWTPLRKSSRKMLYTGDSIAVDADSKAAINIGAIGRAGLKENTHMRIEGVQKMPVNNSAIIKLKLEKGTVWSAVDAPKGGLLKYEVVTPIAVTAVRGTVLRVELDPSTQRQSIAVVEGLAEMSSPEEEPSFDNLLLKQGTYSEISPGQQPSPPAPIPAEILLEWGRWLKSLILKNPFSRINFEAVYVTPGMIKIVMGPLKPNKKFTRYIPIKFDKEYFGKKPVTVEAAIDRPLGVDIITKIMDVEDEKLMKNILVSVECSPYLRYEGTEKYSGRIQLKCANPDIVFTKSYVEFELEHSPPGYLSKMWDLSLRMKTIIGAIGAFLLLIGLLAAWIYRRTLSKWKRKAVAYVRGKLVKTKLIHFLRARPSGHIVLLSAPFEGEKGAFDLADLSRRSGQAVVGIGSSGSNAIVLSHASIRPFHCNIWASRQRNPTQIFLEPCSDGHLTVNGEQMQDSQQLHDQDLIEIGECRFQFVDRQYSHQVRVRMLDNRVHIGKLEYWDLSQTVFYITDKSKKEEEFLPLSFSQVSHVHFLRDESERDVDIIPRRRRGNEDKKRKPVKITLANNRKMRGFVDRKFNYKESTGVFLYPTSGITDIQYTYIPRSSIESFTIVDRNKNG